MWIREVEFGLEFRDCRQNPIDILLCDQTVRLPSLEFKENTSWYLLSDFFRTINYQGLACSLVIIHGWLLTRFLTASLLRGSSRYFSCFVLAFSKLKNISNIFSIFWMNFIIIEYSDEIDLKQRWNNGEIEINCW